MKRAAKGEHWAPGKLVLVRRAGRVEISGEVMVMPTVMILLVLGACITTVISTMGKCPVWVPLGLLCLWALIKTLPLGS